eukprot:927505_1
MIAAIVLTFCVIPTVFGNCPGESPNPHLCHPRNLNFTGTNFIPIPSDQSSNHTVYIECLRGYVLVDWNNTQIDLSDRGESVIGSSNAIRLECMKWPALGPILAAVHFQYAIFPDQMIGSDARVHCIRTSMDNLKTNSCRSN